MRPKLIPLAAFLYAAFGVAAPQTVTLRVPTIYLNHANMMQQFDETAIRQVAPNLILSSTTDHNGVTTEDSKAISGGTVTARKVVSQDGDISLVEFSVDTTAANGLLKAQAENHKLHQELMSISDNLIPDHQNQTLLQQAARQKQAAVVDGNIDAIIQTTNNEITANELRDCPISITPVITSFSVTPGRTNESTVTMKFKLTDIHDPCGNDVKSIYSGHSGHVIASIGRNRFTGDLSVKPNQTEYEIYQLTTWNIGDNFMNSRGAVRSDIPTYDRYGKIMANTSGRTRYKFVMNGNNEFTLSAVRVVNDTINETSKPLLVFVP